MRAKQFVLMQLFIVVLPLNICTHIVLHREIRIRGIICKWFDNLSYETQNNNVNVIQATNYGHSDMFFSYYNPHK